MLAFVFLPLYLLFNIYVARWLIKWMGACSKHFKKPWTRALIMLVYVFFASAFLLAYFMPDSEVQRFFKQIGFYWLGVMGYTLFTIVIVDLLRIILKKIKRIDKETLHSRRTFVLIGTLCVLVITAVSVIGAVNARIVRTTEYEITVNKTAGDLEHLNIVLVADLHLGYQIGHRQMERMVEKINAANPDLVVIAGDIFDNDYDALEDPQQLISILQSINSPYGVYACYGNHDIHEKVLAGFTFRQKDIKKESDPRMDQFLETAGITLLRDEAVLIDESFYLYGRPDLKRPGRGIEERKTPREITENMDPTLPIIVLDHEPAELQELADAGVDLDLCGHTHDGQMFPGNIVIRFLWENSCGYLQKDQMHNIVTSGVGLYGPNMRIGTKAEICPITVHFQPANETKKPSES